jgi:hypothetical protein
MEIEVFSDRRLTTTAEWQRAIGVERFPLRLDADVKFESSRGFVPAVLGDSKTGFECFHDDAREAMASFGRHFDRPWRFALGIRWVGSRVDELQAAWMAATAYAAATDGIVFDCEESKALKPQQARDAIHRIKRQIPRMEELVAEIKRKFSAKP